MKRVVLGALLFTLCAPLAADVRPTQPARGGIVVSDHHLASTVGRDILAAGGNAVDAAVATAFALAVVHPSAGNIGGGGFLLYHGADGEVTSFDFREKAPLAATENLFLDADGSVRADSNEDGPLSVGVPGTVAGLWMAHRRLGTMEWRRLVQPAVDLARDGFPVSWELMEFMEGLAAVEHPWYTETRRIFLDDGRPWEPGSLLVQGDLAATLERIRDEGRDGFYLGETARRLAATMERHGGLITEEDLALYEAVEQEPVRGAYRGYDVYGMAPPSSGGIAVVTMLNVLEPYDLEGLGHNSAAYLHLLAEAMRRAFADRAEHLGDPAFNPEMPVARLISKEHAARLRASIEPHRASPSSEDELSAPYLARPESEETTHFSVVDAEGSAVSLTYTLEASYGSHMTVERGGFLLNNEMGDFNPIPGETTDRGQIGTPPNLVAPGKRMLSSMSPTIVARDGRPLLVVGSPGGRTIINTTVQVILNVLDHGMNVAEAVTAARIHHQWLPDELVIERWGVSPDTRALLEARGHRLKIRDSSQGRANVIRVDPETGLRHAAADPRADNAAAVGQ
ncbi:MAG: gamma-glutamyltransferase [Thermoanaerobaculia bacterium]|nr:gamma-glutamyltransferase [Thermoanaerobaculia bacterium]